MKWLMKRIVEPSTFAGLSVVLAGLLSIIGVPHSTEVSQVVIDGLGDAVSGDMVGAGLVIASGLLSIFMPERGRA